MNKNILLFFLLIAVPFQVSLAEQISVEKAHQVASAFIGTQPSLRSSGSNEITHVYTAKDNAGLRNAKEMGYYHVFNVGAEEGFVIISGDDVALPVLGYSTTGKYDSSNLPPAFEYWMQCLQQEIAAAVNEGDTQSADIENQWNTYLNESSAQLRSVQAIAPLLSTKWDQRSPFNLLCPQSSATGCVATAMAQIMKYYNYPANGKGIIPSYQTQSMKWTIPAVNLDQNAAYDWQNMLADYSWGATSEQQNAVAQLMYHCGVAVEMDYTTSESGAYATAIGKALTTYFGYDASIQAKQRVFYQDVWDDMLRNEINNGRPVYYAAEGSGAHAFICDGYDDSGRFHFNWGWSGSNNGYYVTTALNPGSASYNKSQVIILNIFPDRGYAETYEMKLKENTTIQYVTPMSSVAKGEEFDVSVTFENAGANDFTGSFGVALVNEQDDIVEIISTAGFMNDERYFYFNEWLPESAAYVSAFTFSCAISDQVAAGNYHIKAAVRPESTSDWSIIDGESGVVDYLAITLTNSTRADGSNLYLYNHGNAGYTTGFSVSELQTGSPATFKFMVANTGSTFLGDLGLYIYTEYGELMQVIEKNSMKLESGVYYRILNETAEITVPEGNYILALYAKPTVGESFLLPAYGNSYQNRMKITVKGGTGIDNIKQSESVKIYPNPVSDVLYVDNEDGYINEVHIFDLLGKEVKAVSSINSYQASIPVNELAKGTYITTVVTESGKVSKKIIKY